MIMAGGGYVTTSILRDSYPCVVKNKPYGSSNGLIRMAQGQRSGIDSGMVPRRYQISDLAPYRKGNFLTIQGPESRSTPR
jgi:hypothetical protein